MDSCNRIIQLLLVGLGLLIVVAGAGVVVWLFSASYLIRLVLDYSLPLIIAMAGLLVIAVVALYIRLT